MKSLPAFDGFAMTNAEPIEFGSKTTNARHFTDFSLQHATGNAKAKVDPEVSNHVDLMNPMFFIGRRNPGCAQNWWIRHGSSGRDTSLPIIVNLATTLENQERNVDALLYWDAGHGVDADPEQFVAWVGKPTGFVRHK
ncbi:MAG: hypothetical protein P4L46_04935 [Fimbriimonas sp.]|nr:hypothetical protein [Fimbriimonas sp.]